MMDALTGFTIKVSESLVGFKKAVRDGKTLWVSPAMHDLLTHSEGDELQRVVQAIDLIDATSPEGTKLLSIEHRHEHIEKRWAGVWKREEGQK